MMVESHKSEATVRPASAEGFTLIELIVAVAVTSILMVAIGSTMVVATHALPDREGPAGAVIAASEVAGQIAAELQYAVSVAERSPRTVEFTVADRDDDEVPETIRYEWSGTIGDSLTRQYNSGAVVNVLDRVQDFDLSYHIETISTENATEDESTETLLISYETTADLGDITVTEQEWHGEYFLPSLPAETVSWSVTRIQFYAKSFGGTDGAVKVQLQLPDEAGLPWGRVLEEKTLLESTLLDTYLKQDLTFSAVSGVSPQQGLCLVFRYDSGADGACSLQACVQQSKPPNMALVQTTNRGATWAAPGNKNLLLSVYGTATTAGTPVLQSTHFLRSIGIRLCSGWDRQSDVQTRVRTLNRPEVIL